MKKISKILMMLFLLFSLVIFGSISVDAATENGLTFEEYNRYVINKPFDELPYTIEMEIKLDNSITGKAGTVFGNFDYIVNGSSVGVSRIFNIEIVNGLVQLKYTNRIYEKEVISFDGINVSTSDWIHLTVAFDKTHKQVHLYVDGELKSTKSVNEDLSEIITETGFHIGGNNLTLNPEWFKGEMRELSVYSDLRTDAEIKSDYQNGVDLNDANLLAQYNLSSSDVHKDLSDNSGNDYWARYEDTWYDNQEIEMDYAYSLAVVGDTQMLNCYGKDSDMNTLYKWIVDNQESQKIAHVFGLGDITETWDKDKQWKDYIAKNPSEAGNPNIYLKEWQRAKDAIYQMNGKVSYNLVRGNHDETKYLNQYFNEEVYTSQFDGFFDDTVNTFYQTRKIGNVDYLFIGLDYGASNEELEWACNVVENFPNHKVIVTTHGYLGQEGNAMKDDYPHTPSTGSDFETDLNTNNGEEIWEKFICKYENIFLVMSGHINDEDIVYNQRYGVHGNVVTEMLIDFQDVDLHLIQTKGQEGAGIVTMLYFSEDGTQVELAAYSTIRNQFYKKYNHFTIDLDGQCNGNHNFEAKHDAYKHWEECSCGYVKGLNYHEYKDFTMTSNGTRLYTCSCGVTKEGSNANDDVTLQLQALLERYYNTGSYIKDTKIYIDPNKVGEELASYFHANVSILDRTTYYDGDKLWMSAGSDYSGYGTSSDGHLTTFRVSLDNVFGKETVLPNLPGMEDYYCTLQDLILGQHTSAHTNHVTLNLNDGWTYENGVYSNTNPEVLDAFRLFTAPGWLGKNGTNGNYIDYAKATIEATNGQLILKLWVSATELDGKLQSDSEVVGDYAVFSKAVISEYYWKGNVSSSLRGSGNEENPYIIESYADLLHFQENAKLYAGKYVKLDADIDLKGQNFTIDSFAGIFDGAGHKISGLDILGSGMSTGLFSVLEKGGVIKNLSVSGKVVGLQQTAGIVGESYGDVLNCINYADVLGNNCVGGVVGNALEGSVTNCQNYGYIDSKPKGWHVAGIVGESHVMISNCTNHGDVRGLTTHIGGIVGSAIEGGISECINNGDVIGAGYTAGPNGAWGIGGIAGANEVMVSDCVNNGNIISTSTVGFGQAGGIVGKAYATIKNCTNKGSVKVNSGLIGGIVGDGYAGTTIESCYNYGEINCTAVGANMVGGIAGRISSGTVKSSENYANITATGMSVGGIVGELQVGSVVQSINKGNINANYNIGGIVGKSAGLIDNCQNYGQIEGKNEIGGIVGVTTSTISNCINEGIVSSTSSHSAGIVGNTKGDVISCTNNGQVTGSWGVGGIAGISEGSKFEDCINNGSIVNSSGQIGGIVGKANGNTIINCSNSADIIAKDGSVGGIVGAHYDDAKAYLDIVISNCNNTGIIQGTSNLGGIIGDLQKGSVKDSNNYAKVTGTGGAIGGIVGYSRGTVENCINNVDATISGGSWSVAGVVGHSEGNVISCKNYAVVTGTGGGVAGIVGELVANKNIKAENCVNSGNVTGAHTSGGIVGYGRNNSVIGCENSGNIVGTHTSTWATSIGGIVGGMDVAGGLIKDCLNTGNVSNNVGGIGGIIGVTKGNIENCENTGVISSKANIVGGIVANFGGTSLLNCTNRGNVKGTNTTAGVAAKVYNSTKVTVSGCVNYGTINGSAYFSAGLFGTLDNATASDCFNHGEISSTSDCVGGIVAAMYEGGVLINCDNFGNVKGTTNVGGIAFQCRGGKITDCDNEGTYTATKANGLANGICANNTGTITNCIDKTAK